MTHLIVEFQGAKIKVENRGIANINIRNFFLNYTAIYANQIGSDSILVGISDKPWVYLDVQSERGLEMLLVELPKTYNNFAVVEPWAETVIHRFYGGQIFDELRCKKLCLSESDFIKSAVEDCWWSEREKLVIGPLRVEESAYIQANHKYADFTDEPYITDRILKGIHFGVRTLDGQLVAWVLTHDDGAIGFLYVMEAYRGRGIASKLIERVVEEHFKRNMIPFVHIEVENLPSLNLVQKSGFKQVGDVAWFSLKE